MAKALAILRFAISIGAVIGLSACAGAPRSGTVAQAEGIRKVRYVGRFDWRDPVGPRYAWSGSTMRARFRGRSIAFRVHAGAPLEGGPVPEKVTPYTVTVDDVKRTFDVGPMIERYELARDLDPNIEHEVSVVREAEAMAGVHQFLGFEVDGELRDAPPPRPHAIEVVGDSITCGYGVLGSDKTCRFSYTTERASLAFAALAAEKLDADLTTVCWSGLGVIRNYDGTKTPTMPELFERTVPGSKEDVPWVESRHDRTPDAVIVALGTNDIEDATKTPLDLAAFESRYVSLLARIRDVYPTAWLLVAESPLIPPEPTPSGPGLARDLARGALSRIIASRQKAGETKLELLAQPWADGRFGCDWHPNAEMQRILGDLLVTALQPKLRSVGARQ